MAGCLFCKIVAGDVPSTGVVSTETTYAFRDVAPQAPTHVLVVPRTHVDNAHELGAEHSGLLADMIATAQSVAESEGVVGSGYRLVFNVGPDALNSVPHLHLHVLGGRSLGRMAGA